MKITKVLNQKVTYEKCTGNNDYAEYTYEAPITIPARIERKTQMVERTDGSIRRATNVIYSDREIFPGDKINGSEILTVSDYIWRDGSVQGYEATT